MFTNLKTSNIVDAERPTGKIKQIFLVCKNEIPTRQINKPFNCNKNNHSLEVLFSSRIPKVLNKFKSKFYFRMKNFLFLSNYHYARSCMSILSSIGKKKRVIKGILKVILTKHIKFLYL